MRARVKWVEGRLMVGESGSGHCVVMDGPAEVGGRDLGIRPMELLLLGAAGCTQFDVLSILEKARQKVTSLEVEVAGERADSDPKVYTKIHILYRITGKDLTESAVKRAIELSAEKYCSATVMLGATAEVTHSYEIIAAE